MPLIRKIIIDIKSKEIKFVIDDKYGSCAVFNVGILDIIDIRKAIEYVINRRTNRE